ncbi:MAG: hypothetical protein AAF741_02745 [Bacteroidota bacterium]
MHLNHKNILITGGSIRIVLELAKQLSLEDARVLICARNIKPLEQVNKNNPGVESFKLMSAEEFARRAVRGIKKGKMKYWLVVPVSLNSCLDLCLA